ncbi:RNA recognition motif-containing protein [Besnoitia besnoiti]|uniref:Nuclear cap-binding protein subunit 2 n=1 Tax=Besnoitia besnoiti TaxID=94643 RepID=A0A2A9M858_BESBE|nr:RNA recognition motif-containing protein [Besnoitia besnoiti]PFH32106.1 RNA recognition motif-containing protein [Besnoitia besnoiti]
MSRLYVGLKGRDTYYDRRTARSQAEWKEKVSRSCTVYVGNLNFSTTEDELYEIFSYAGLIRRVVMGLNRQTRAPCGFAFVEYFRPLGAKIAISVLNGCSCDGRVIRVDADSGEDIDGDRKYGRGFTGRQWRDEYREDYDQGRGGEGRKRAREEFAFVPAPPGLFYAAAAGFPAQPAFVAGAGVVATDGRNVRAKTMAVVPPPPPGVLSTDPALPSAFGAVAVGAPPPLAASTGFGGYLQLVGNAQNAGGAPAAAAARGGQNPFAGAGTSFFRGGRKGAGGRRR